MHRLGKAPLDEGEDPYGFGRYSPWGDHGRCFMPGNPSTALPPLGEAPLYEGEDRAGSLFTFDL